MQKSRPVRARGLKHIVAVNGVTDIVAPRAGAWIETEKHDSKNSGSCRAPCGRVD